MADLWGCRLPIRSYQRGFRPTYRNAVKSTVVLDQSYFKCLQIESSSENCNAEILKLLALFTARGVSAHFGFKPALNGDLEMQTLVYEPNKYPYGFVGPVRFSWTKNS